MKWMEKGKEKRWFGTNHYFNNFYYIGENLENLVIKEHTINQLFGTLFFFPFIMVPMSLLSFYTAHCAQVLYFDSFHFPQTQNCLQDAHARHTTFEEDGEKGGIKPLWCCFNSF